MLRILKQLVAVPRIVANRFQAGKLVHVLQPHVKPRRVIQIIV